MNINNTCYTRTPMPHWLQHTVCLGLCLFLGACHWQQHGNTEEGSWTLGTAPSSSQTEPESAAAKQQRKINFLLEKADLAFRKDRLTAPMEDNAVLYYHNALKIDRDNKKAHAGLAKVAYRLRDLALTAHKNGNGKQARRYLKQAEILSGAKDPANEKLRKTLLQTPQGQDPRALDRPIQEKLDAKKDALKDKLRTLQHADG
ncbi:MAG: hypothetical protein IT470_04915 [Pseudomonadales bacterium]|nr:hypothetical protein [Pseudomonadales bacterium]